MITTYNQAKRLKELGYREMVWQYFCDGKLKRSKIICDYNADSNMDDKVLISAPYISDALQWIREKYEIGCGVSPEYTTVKVGEYYAGGGHNGHIVKVKYRYRIEFYDEKNNWHSKILDTYPEAESQLLDELLTYLEQKR